MPSAPTQSRAAGFSLLELIIALGFASMVLALAVPAYSGYVDRANESRAIADLSRIELELRRFRVANWDQLPDSLAEVNWDEPDPWGRPYEYLRIEGGGANRGQLRKDRNLVPVNTDFDLYSTGRDGRSVPPFTAKHSRDDIVRAGNGAFVGRAEKY